MQMGTMKVIHLAQPTTALAKNLTINVGWRPSMAMVFNYAADKDWAVAFDGISAPTGGLKMNKDDTASAAVGADGITFHDKGIKLGQDAGIVTEASANIIVVLFRDIQGIAKVTLSDLDETKKAFGTGAQFKQDDFEQFSDPVTVTADA